MKVRKKLKIVKSVVSLELSPTLTNGQVAALLSVAPRTVSQLKDRGQLAGFTLPGSPDRRFYLDDVLRLMRDNGMRIDPQLDDTADRISYGVSFDIPSVTRYNNELDLGLYLGKTFRLRIAYVGDSNGILDMYRIIDTIRQNQPHAVVVGLYTADNASRMNTHDGADARFMLPTNLETMVEEVHKIVPNFHKARNGVALKNPRGK